MWKWECGLRPVGAIGAYAPEGSGNAEWGILNGEVGMRPPASPSCRLYEPEAVGVIGAYAPEGMRKRELTMQRAESIEL